jgi:Carboxypeptidase regulatory-like domain
MSRRHAERCLRTVLVLCLLLGGAASLMGQSAGTGALTGSIKDVSGAVIPNAKVTLTSLDTQQTRTTMTETDGTYKFSLLPPGNYSLRIEAPGFRQSEVPSVTVNVTETEVLDRNLQVGEQTQAITVESAVEAIQTTSSALGTVATARTLTELPLSTRNYTNLLYMSSGVNANVNNATTIGKGTVNMAVNGANVSQNTYLIDGVAMNNWTSIGSVTDGGFIGSFVQPIPDAISEFKIQTSSYDAGYGRNPGANVNLVLKSGTNAFHGDVFEFFRNAALNANDWFLNRQGIPKPELNSNQYGATIGGPIKKDKAFFFLSYQGTDQRNGLSPLSETTTFLPPIPAGNRGTCNGGQPGWYTISACDAAGQAFITNLAQSMCSSKPKSGTATIQCPSAGPGDPSGLFNINPVAINILQLKFPGGPQAGNYVVPGSGNSRYRSQSFTDPATFRDRQAIANLDYIINSKNTFSGRYIFGHDPLLGYFGAQNALSYVADVPGNTFQNTKTDQDAIAKLTSTLSNTVVNEFYGFYQRDRTYTSASVYFTNPQVGIQPLASPYDPTGVINNLSFFSVAGGATSGLLNFGGTVGPFGSGTIVNQFAVGDDVSWTRGKHSFRAGFETYRIQADQFTPSFSVGNPSYQTFADFLIGRAGCGTGLAVTPSALNPGGCNGSTASNLASAGATSSANGNMPTNGRVVTLSGFIQDDIKVKERLTVNLGLRWEFDQWPTEENGLFANFVPSVASIAPAPFVTVPGGPGSSLAGYVVPSNYSGAFIPSGVFQSNVPYVTQKSAPWDNFAPRVGFAWQPTSSNKLVVRGGAGYFYDLTPGSYDANFYRMGPVHGPPNNGSPSASDYNPWAVGTGLVSAGPGYFGFQSLWVDPSTVSTNPAAACFAPPCSSNLAPTSQISQSLTVPLTYEWNMNAQYEFLPSWVLEVGYVGSHGIHQADAALSSATSNTAGSPATAPYNLAQLVGGPCVSCGVTGVTANTTANAVLRVPVLGVSPTAAQIVTNVNYKYNSVQATVRKQFSKGLQLQAAYTFARGFMQSPQGVNTYPYIVETYSPEFFVRPQRLVVSYVWNLPFGHQRGWVGQLTNGWSWSGVTVVQDGNPQDIVDSSSGKIFGLSSGTALAIGHAQLCPGMTLADVATSGSTTERVTSGLEGGNGWVNSAAFCTPPNVGAINGVGGGEGFGNMGVGSLLGPGQNNWDMSLAKLFQIRESKSLTFRAEFYNTFNHPQFGNLAPTGGGSGDDANARSGGGLGEITTTSVNPRVIQFGLKYLF